jgi:ParB family chromosome partitioning protein
VAKKSFTEKIKDDFKVPVIEEKEAADRKRAKPVPGARLIPLSDISLDSGQPRKKLDEEKLSDLAASIKSKGVIEPITVRQADEGYMIITGERRYKAAQLAGLEEIPCIVKQVTDEETLTYQLIENLQREDLSPIDEAAALKKLLGTGLTQAQTAKMIGKSQPYISQALKILDLPQNILEEAERTEVAKESLLQLTKAKEPEQLQIWEDLKAGSTAEDVKVAVKKEKPSKGRPRIKPWTWKPEDKSFTVSIKFKNKDYDEEEIIKALVQLVDALRQTTLLPK